MIREFVQSIDDREWQTQLFALLQKQTYNQVEVDLFELMCKVLDQNLFSQVDWARNTVFFKDLKVWTNTPISSHRVNQKSEIRNQKISKHRQQQHGSKPKTSFQTRGQVCGMLCKPPTTESDVDSDAGRMCIEFRFHLASDLLSQQS